MKGLSQVDQARQVASVLASRPEAVNPRRSSRSGRGSWWKIGLGVAIVTALGISLWAIDPDYGQVWSQVRGFTQSFGLMAAKADTESGPSEIAPPPEHSEPELPRGILSNPGLALSFGLATAGAFDAVQPPLLAVELSSPEIAKRIGLQTAPAVLYRHVPSIVGNAEIAYNANLYGEVRPRVPGIVREIATDVGALIHQGQTMLVIDSAEIGTAKTDYLAALPVEELARQMHEMVVELRKRNAAAPKEELTTRAELNKAKAAVLNTRQRLKNFGFTDSDLSRIAAQEDTSTMFEIVSPLEGEVVERHAVPGEAIGPTDQVFVVADTRTMWAWIDVYESEIEQVQIGQPVTFTISGTDSPVFQGQVQWIDAAVNPATRTIRVRAELQNSGGRLRALAFGRARIQTGPERDALHVPRDAVQELDGERLVFEPLGPGRYQPRKVVTTRAEDPKRIEILSGLAPGTEVVTTGAFLLKSEIIRRQVGFSAGD